MRETIVCDYDGVLELKKGVPNSGLILWLNAQGKRVIVWTSRDWLYYDYIEHNLKQWGLEFEGIVCGKPLGDLYIDDRATKWEDLLR